VVRQVIERISVIVLALGLLPIASCASKAQYSDDAFVTSAARLRPSVVLLSMDVPGESKKDGPDTEYATGTVVASGKWGSDILTVEHAIEDAWNLHVTVNNKEKAPAAIIAKDADLDIALVRTKRPNLPVVHLGSSVDAQPGRMIGLLGYPIPDQFDDEGLGLATSLTSGRVSSLRQDAIEVTLQIVPGESGSPVFLADTGEVVGMAESRFDEERSIGFALPIEDAEHFLHKYDADHGL
jgi:S1-C subfamily serine protease